MQWFVFSCVQSRKFKLNLISRFLVRTGTKQFIAVPYPVCHNKKSSPRDNLESQHTSELSWDARKTPALLICVVDNYTESLLRPLLFPSSYAHPSLLVHQRSSLNGNIASAFCSSVCHGDSSVYYTHSKVTHIKSSSTRKWSVDDGIIQQDPTSTSLYSTFIYISILLSFPYIILRIAAHNNSM